MISREDIITCARFWLGTPWEHQGRVMGRGIDCVGLITSVGRELGLPVKDILGYSKNFPSSLKLQEGLRKQFLSIEAAGTGDILLLTMHRSPVHLAIMNENSMIHVTYRRGCVEHSINDRWLKMITGFFAYKGVPWLH